MGVWNCGQSMALVDDVPTCMELVERIINEATDTMNRLNGQFNSNL